MLFPDETKVFQLLDFGLDGLNDFGTKVSLRLINWFDLRINVQSLHGYLGIKTRHVLISLSEDIHVLAYELYHVFSHGGWQAFTNKDGLGIGFVPKVDPN